MGRRGQSQWLNATAPAVAGRLGALLAKSRPPGRPSLHRASSRMVVKDLYATDHADLRQGGRFRWLVSTCLAATVGAIAILVVIYGSSDPGDTPDGLLPTLKRMSESAAAPGMSDLKRRQDGLKWQVPRTDRLQVTSGAMSTRYTIHEMLRQRVGGRDKIYAKRYVRIVGRLTPVPSNYSDVIPPFNPFRLFANNNPVGSGDSETELSDARTDVAIKVVELLGGILPEEDGQELAESEVEEIVERTESGAETAAAPDGTTPGAGGALAAGTPSAADLQNAQNSTILAKSAFDADDSGGAGPRSRHDQGGPGRRRRHAGQDPDRLGRRQMAVRGHARAGNTRFFPSPLSRWGRKSRSRSCPRSRTPTKRNHRRSASMLWPMAAKCISSLYRAARPANSSPTLRRAPDRTT